MKYSNGLKNLLSPLWNVCSMLDRLTIAGALKRVGKRGNGAYYPNDAKRICFMLDCTNDTTGHKITVEVDFEHGGFQPALDRIREFLLTEDMELEEKQAAYDEFASLG